MRSSLARCCFLVAVCLAWCAGRVTADPYSYQVREGAEYGTATYTPHQKKGLFSRWAQKEKEPCGCWGHHDAYRCGSLRSEIRFIFGSCRSFFAEDCLKAAPPGFEHEYIHKTHPPHLQRHLP